MSAGRVERIAGAGLRFLPSTRQELGRAMLAEAATLQPGSVRRTWLRSAYWFIVKGAAPLCLRWVAITGSALFILWTLYNGIDSGFQGTPVEITSFLTLWALLALNIILLTRRSR